MHTGLVCRGVWLVTVMPAHGGMRVVPRRWL